MPCSITVPAGAPRSVRTLTEAKLIGFLETPDGGVFSVARARGAVSHFMRRGNATYPVSAESAARIIASGAA